VRAARQFGLRSFSDPVPSFNEPPSRQWNLDQREPYGAPHAFGETPSASPRCPRFSVPRIRSGVPAKTGYPPPRLTPPRARHHAVAGSHRDPVVAVSELEGGHYDYRYIQDPGERLCGIQANRLRTPNRRARAGRRACPSLVSLPVGGTTAGVIYIIPRCYPVVTDWTHVETAEGPPFARRPWCRPAVQITTPARCRPRPPCRNP
jgi:hypothetical protein